MRANHPLQILHLLRENDGAVQIGCVCLQPELIWQASMIFAAVATS